MVSSAAQSVHPGRAVRATALKYLIAVAGQQRQWWPSFASMQLSERRIETMAIDWLATLAEQGDFAKSKATEVATLVLKPDLLWRSRVSYTGTLRRALKPLTASCPTWTKRMSVTNCWRRPIRWRNCGASFLSHQPTSSASCKASHRS